MTLSRLALAAVVPVVLLAASTPARADDVSASVVDPAKDAPSVVDVVAVSWYFSDVSEQETLTATARLVKLTEKTTIHFRFKEKYDGGVADLQVRRVNGKVKFTRFTNGGLRYGPQSCDGPKPTTSWDKAADTVTLVVPGECLTLDGTGDFDSSFFVTTSHATKDSTDKTKAVQIKGAFVVHS